MFFIPGHRMKDHTFTLGIEEEFAIIDPETRELRSHIHEILEGGKITLKEQIKPEMHQSVVELGTEICDSIGCAREHVTGLRTKLAELAARTIEVMSTSSFRKIPDISSERLWLADAARTGLAAGLGLLGIDAPPRL